MSTTVDNRVVQMSMDNKKFESGAEETLSTLDKLKRALKMDDATEGFDKVQDAANNLSLSSIATSVQSISDRFSGLGIVGMTMWQHIGDAAWDFVNGALSAVGSKIDAVTNQIKTGGWNRALNLEKAEMMINTLGEASGDVSYAWDKTAEHYKEGMLVIKDVVNDAVSGTAYSLDEAAVASSNFLATGVKDADQLYNTLRAIMGTASTYSKDFSTISRVFQNVSARGYLMYGDISDLQANGVAASQVLMDYLHLEPEQLQEAYKDHLITFEMFTDAFNDQFGDSLDKANSTYEGSLSNLKSAMSRIGAEVATPLLENLIPLFNNLRILTNTINTMLKETGIYDLINDTLGSIIGKVVELTKYEKDENGILKTTGAIIDPIANIIYGIANAGEFFKDVILAIGEAFNNVFGNTEGEGFLTKITRKFYEFFNYISEYFPDFRGSVVKGFETFFKIIKTGIGVVKKLLGVFKSVASVIFDFAKSVFNAVKGFIDFNKLGKTISDIVETITVAFDTAKTLIGTIFTDFKTNVLGLEEDANALEVIKKIFEDVFSTIYEKVSGAVQAVSDFIGIDFHIPSLDEIKNFIDNVLFSLRVKLEEVKVGLRDILSDPDGAWQGFKSKVGEPLEFIKEKLEVIASFTGEKFKGFTDWIGEFKDKIGGAKDSVAEFADVSDTKLNGAEKTFSIFTTLRDGLKKLSEVLGPIKEFAVSVGGGIFEILKGVFEKVKEVVGDMEWKDIFNMLKVVIAYVIAIDFDTLLQKLTTFITNINNLLNTKEQMAVIKYKNTFRSIGAMILEFGIAVALFAYAIGKLNDMDLDRSKESVKLIAEIIGVFTGAFIIMNKKLSGLGEATGISGFGTTMLELAITVAIMAKAMASLGGLKSDQIVPIMGAFAGALAEIIGSMFAISKLMKGTSAAFLKSVGFMMIEMSVAVLLMSTAMSALAKLSPDDFNQGIIGMSALVGLLAAFVAIVLLLNRNKVGANSASFVAIGVAMQMLAISINLMLPAIIVLGKLKPDELNQGIVAVGLIMALFSVVMLLAGLAAKMDKMALLSFAAAATAFVEIAFAIDALVPAVIILGMLPKEQLTQGIIALGVVMTLFTVLAAVAGKASSITGVAAIVAITISMHSMTKNISVLSEIDGEKLKRAIIAISVAIIEFVAAGLIVKKAKLGPSLIALSESMLIFSVGLMAMAGALKILGSMSIGEIVQSIVSLAAIMAVMVVAAAALKALHLGPTLMELSVSMLAMGAGAFLLATGLTLFCTALTLLGPAVAIAIRGLSKIFEAITDFAEDFEEMCDELVSAVETLAKDFVKVLLAGLIGALEGLEESIGDLVDTAVDVICDIIDALTKRVGDIVVSLFNFIVELIYEVGDYLGTHDKEILDALQSLIAGILEVALGLVDRFVEFGKNICEGILEGMVKFEWWDKLTDWVADHIIAPICDFLGIASPSKYMEDHVGIHIVEGLWEAFVNGAKTIYNNIKNWISENIIQPIKDFFTDIFNAGKDLFNSFKEGLESVIDAILELPGKIWDGICSFFEDPFGTMFNLGKTIINNLKDGMEAVKDKVLDVAGFIWDGVTGFFNKIKDGAESIIDKFFGIKHLTEEEFKESEWGQNYLNTVSNWTQKQLDKNKVSSSGESLGTSFGMGFGDGVVGMQNYVNSQVKSMMSGAIKTGAKTIDSHSPSRVMMEYGKYFDEGFAIGISNNADIVAKTTSGMISQVLDVFDEDIVSNPTITPVLDLSEIQNEGKLFTALNNKEVQFVASMDIVGNDKHNLEAMQKMGDYISKMQETSDNSSLVAQIEQQNIIIAALSAKLDSLGVYIDSGVLVGGIVNKMDKALGIRAGHVGRSVKT